MVCMVGGWCVWWVGGVYGGWKGCVVVVCAVVPAPTCNCLSLPALYLPSTCPLPALYLPSTCPLPALYLSSALPDMMVVGNMSSPNYGGPGLTPDEVKTHISLWAVLKSPMLLSCDVRSLDKVRM
jgi:hypothetical protein